jgi:hypothetical protein
MTASHNRVAGRRRRALLGVARWMLRVLVAPRFVGQNVGDEVRVVVWTWAGWCQDGPTERGSWRGRERPILDGVLAAGGSGSGLPGSCVLFKRPASPSNDAGLLGYLQVIRHVWSELLPLFGPVTVCLVTRVPARPRGSRRTPQQIYTVAGLNPSIAIPSEVTHGCFRGRRNRIRHSTPNLNIPGPQHEIHHGEGHRSPAECGH